MATLKIGRSAINGRFKTVTAARNQPNTSVVETIKTPTPPKKPR